MDDALLADGVRYLEHWLDHRQRTLQIPGLVAAVAKDGRLLLHRAYGLADVETGAAMTTEHVFPIASHSKTFTAALVLRLASAGRLRLDDAVGDVVPGLAPPVAAARVRDLLSHSAGVSRDGADADYWQLVRPFPSAAQLPGMAESVLSRHERMKYSNIGFGLLGQVVETVCGAPYADVVRTELLEPLGLRETRPDVDPGRDYATGYTSKRGGAAREPLPLTSTGALAPATGFCATAADLCRFATALCDGNGRDGDDALLDGDSRREMRRVAWTGENGDQDYGLGLSSAMIGERRVYGHGGAYPGFITSTRFDPKERLVVVVLANAIDAPSAELTAAMQRLLGLAAECPAGAPPATAVPGRYPGLWSIVDVAAFGSTLLALDPELPDPVDRRIELIPDPADPARLRIGRSSPYGSPGESVVFDDDGVRFAGLHLERERTW